MSAKNGRKANGSGVHANQSAATSTTPHSSSPPPLVKKPHRITFLSKRKKKSATQYFTRTWLLSALGVASAIVASFYHSRKDWTTVQYFVNDFVCRSGGYCHASLVPQRRTQVSARTIRKGELVLVVPRSLQIWDLDALRHDFVRNELLHARHSPTQNPLESGAFLAAYLALRNHTYTQTDETGEDPLRPYLDVLPSFQELVQYHPALWTKDELVDLEVHSSSFAVAKGYQDMVRSEYQAFVTASTKFASRISEKDFLTMRVHVLSRSFGTGPPSDEESLAANGDDDNTMTMEEEMDLYKTKAGVDLSLGCHAMTPLLDMYNHHAHPNVEWEYSTAKRAFVVRAASGGIPEGHEVMDSYGKYTDAHLFAKFGFVNGDGSGHTQASIAAMHKPQRFGISHFSYIPFAEPDKALKDTMRRVMVRYLSFDDGYEECIEEDKHPEAFELKRLKLEHLVRLANTPERWIYNVGPRDDSSKPGKTTELPITLQPPRFHKLSLDFQGRNIISTCRLITLHHDDFNSTAIELLKEGVQNETALAFVGPDSHELEYRALMCLARLTGLKLLQYQSDEEKEVRRVRELNILGYGGRNWTMSHVRLGEEQTLDIIRKMGLQGAKDKGELIRKKLGDPSDDFLPTFRTEKCQTEYSDTLLEA